IAIIGTGVIGASWSALFLAKGLKVAATDPRTRRRERAAAIRRGGLAGARTIGACTRRVAVEPELHGRPRHLRRRRRPGAVKRPGTNRFQAKTLWAARRVAAARGDHRVELVRPDDERDPNRLPSASRTMRHRR